MLGNHVDKMAFRDVNGGVILAGSPGGEAGPPLVLAPGEFIAAVHGGTGCGFVACWLRMFTSTGRYAEIGGSADNSPMPAVGADIPDGGFKLTPSTGFGFVGLELSDDGGAPTMLERSCDAPAPPAPPPGPVTVGVPGANLISWHDFDLSEGGSGWAPGLYEHASAEYAGFYLRASYSLCTATQTVDLLQTSGIFSWALSMLTVRAAVTVKSYARANDADDFYYVRYALLDGSENILAEFAEGDEWALEPIGAGAPPRVVSHDFAPAILAGYTVNGVAAAPRYLRFEFGGRDGEHWSGAYGPSFHDMEVSLINLSAPSPPTPPAPPAPPSPPPPPLPPPSPP